MPAIGARNDQAGLGRARTRRATPAPRTKPGCCLRRAPCRPAMRRIKLDGQRRHAHRQLLRAGDRRRNCSTTRSSSPIRARRPVEAVVTTVAAPAQPLPAGGDGFTIERTYYTLDGTEANVTEATQNERYVVVLKINEENDWPSRVLVTDLLPAGFEIDNPGLVSSAESGEFRLAGADRGRASRIPRRPLRRGLRPRRRATTAPSPGLCGARGDARRLRASGRRRRGHVPAAIFGPHLDRHDGGEGAVSALERSLA